MDTERGTSPKKKGVMFMAVSSFIPELWSARLLANLEATHVATNFVNRFYDGEIRRAGDTVHINSLGDITVSTYTPNQDMADPEELATTDQTLTISQAKSFNFCIDDVDKAQAAGDLMEQAMEKAAYALNQTADAYIFNTLKAGAEAMTAMALTKDNVYAAILSMKQKLDEANVPLDGRCLAISPAVHALLLQDSRFVGGTAAGDKRLKTGEVGQVAGFAVYLTNNLPTTTAEDSQTKASVTTTYLMAGHPLCCAYAEQIASVEAYRLEKRFADALKGLHLYGAKVVCKDALAMLPVTLG